MSIPPSKKPVSCWLNREPAVGLRLRSCHQYSCSINKDGTKPTKFPLLYEQLLFADCNLLRFFPPLMTRYHELQGKRPLVQMYPPRFASLTQISAHSAFLFRPLRDAFVITKRNFQSTGSKIEQQ